ncbi:HU family DNA-binding protein [Candidatus Williamhamiltonella defendens]
MRNPKTGKTIELTECHVPSFRFGKSLKAALKGLENVGIKQN